MYKRQGLHIASVVLERINRHSQDYQQDKHHKANHHGKAAPLQIGLVGHHNPDIRVLRGELQAEVLRHVFNRPHLPRLQVNDFPLCGKGIGFNPRKKPVAGGPCYQVNPIEVVGLIQVHRFPLADARPGEGGAFQQAPGNLFAEPLPQDQVLLVGEAVIELRKHQVFTRHIAGETEVGTPNDGIILKLFENFPCGYVPLVHTGGLAYFAHIKVVVQQVYQVIVFPLQFRAHTLHLGFYRSSHSFRFLPLGVFYRKKDEENPSQGYRYQNRQHNR